jgi:hypothetical protein
MLAQEDVHPKPLIWRVDPLYSFILSFPATILLVDLARPIVRAPEFPQAPWVNALEPITMTNLRGRVVMVDIWDFT